MKVLVADDEPLARNRLVSLLRQMDRPMEVVGEAGNGLEALRMALAKQPDIAVLDIRMPVLDGIHCARELSKLPLPPAIIFATAYDDYALEAFDVAACDYVLKPVRVERLAAALEKAQRFAQAPWQRLQEHLGEARGPRDRLCAYRHGEISLIALDDVLYFRAEQKYTVVRTQLNESLIEEPLKSLEEEFGDRFLRVHRNALVAISHVVRLEKQPTGKVVLLLRGSAEALEVSRRCLPQVRERLKHD